ncbi:Fimbrial assembly family protein [Planctopirus limnophila DSM 3776]|uniref:Fimbrial assembly family protein n=1 Tax=Planctopirus limnophila (strain ATCC 43296 / DSM 3776 / IFAM 1008 / Mu 290) TaxID=521674 RepID=D5SU44_PLAL2|nr:PilN domain-containing protein [Planctopirus limnophila]ADG69097.1 Fimbrial assembly family protein [Planctopirus limnophila DSM 3776]
MSEIDFLPAGYHRDREKRLRRRWHRVVSIVFAGLVIAGTVGQWSRVSRDRTRLLHLQSSVATARAGVPEAAPLQAELDRLIEHERVIKVLEQDHSLASILDEVNGLRPPGVSLSEIHWQNPVSTAGIGGTGGSSASSNSGSPGRSSATSQNSQRPESLFAPGELLNRTLAELAQRQPTLQLIGLAPDHLAMANYLNALEASNNFVEVRLELSQAQQLNDLELQQFQILLKLRPLGQSLTDAKDLSFDKHPAPAAKPVERIVPAPGPDFTNEHEIARDILPHQTAEQSKLNKSTKN